MSSHIRPLNAFQVDKKNMDINDIALKYLKEIMTKLSTERRNEYFSEESLKNINETVMKMNIVIDPNGSNELFAKNQSCMDSLCCRICAEEPAALQSSAPLPGLSSMQ